MIRTNRRKHWATIALAAAAALSISTATSRVFAAAPAAAAPQPFEKQLEHEFPGAQMQDAGAREINGVQVHEVKVNTPNGQSNATVTADGDILLATIPHKTSELPPDVAAISQGLFGSAPSNVESFIVNNYIVNITTSNGKGYELKIDGTGRIDDIDTKQMSQYENPKNQPKASGADAGKLTKLIQQNFPDAKIHDVHQSPTSPGWYSVDFTTKEGKYAYISMNEDNRVRSYAVQMNQNELPKAVQQTVSEIKGAKINGVLHYTTHYWELQENVNGDSLTIKVKPDGDIINVESAGAKQTREAVTASHKQG
jgi:hypothetical protein